MQPKSSLASFEDRIRKLLKLPGILGATFSSELTASIDAGDLYEPGLSSYAGRRWAWARQWGGAVAVGNEFGLRFDEAVVIERVYSSVATTAAQGFFWAVRTTPGGGAFGAPANPATWRELDAGTAQVGPPMAEAGFAAGAAFGNCIAVQPSGGQGRWDLVQCYIPAGKYLYVQNYGVVVSAADPWFAVHGYVAR